MYFFECVYSRGIGDIRNKRTVKWFTVKNEVIFFYLVEKSVQIYDEKHKGDKSSVTQWS